MHPLVSLAKKAVEVFIQEGKIIEIPENLGKEFLGKKAGVFVTIQKEGKLRGCIGTYLPTKVNVLEETIRNAIAAAIEDYRFEPVKKEELSKLSYIVYILEYPQLVKNLKELDSKKYGILVKNFPLFYPNQEIDFELNDVPKTGLLLPDLEGIDTVEKQIYIACQKAGINPKKEKFFIYKFGVEKYQ